MWSARRASSSSRWTAVAVGASTVLKVSSVTTPKRAPPEPFSAHRRSSSALSTDRPVVQDDARGDELVAREAVQPAEDADPAAEREPRDADRRAAARGDRPAVGLQRVVDLAEPRARADRDRLLVDLDRSHRAGVDQDAGRRRMAGEVVPAAADRDRLPSFARAPRRPLVASRTRRSSRGLMCSNRAIAGRGLEVVERVGDREDLVVAVQALAPALGDAVEAVERARELAVDRGGRVRVVAEVDRGEHAVLERRVVLSAHSAASSASTTYPPPRTSGGSRVERAPPRPSGAPPRSPRRPPPPQRVASPRSAATQQRGERPRRVDGLGRAVGRARALAREADRVVGPRGVRQRDRRELHQRAVAGGVRGGVAGEGLAGLLEAVQRGAGRVADVEAGPGARPVALAVPADVAREAGRRGRTSALDAASRRGRAPSTCRRSTRPRAARTGRRRPCP